jgi:hypothetical protein
VRFLTGGKPFKKRDLVTFKGLNGPVVRIRIIPDDAYEPCKWRTGMPPMKVLRSLRNGEKGRYWCGGVELKGKKKEQGRMNEQFYVRELE